MPQPSVCFLFDLVSGATSDIETPTFVAADDQKRINTKPDCSERMSLRRMLKILL